MKLEFTPILLQKSHLYQKGMQLLMLIGVKNIRKTVSDWAQIIFSDESSVEIGKQSRQIRIWRSVGERFNTDCLTSTFKSSRKSVMVWGCFAGGIKGPLVFCEIGRASCRERV